MVNEFVSELKKVIDRLNDVERFEVNFEQKKTVTYVEINIKYDALKLPKRALSDEAGKYLNRAYWASRDIEDKALVFAKKVRNTKKGFAELVSELKDILNRSEQIISEFDEYLTVKQAEIKELLKKYREENSKAYREARENAKIEKKALLEGDFEMVSDRRIKDFLRTELGLNNITVIDKNSRFRAVLVAEVEHWPYEGWRVSRVILAGVDDNGESWSQVVADYRSDPASLDFIGEVWSVERAMSAIFCVPEWLIRHESTRRQGDVLVIDLNATKLDNRDFKDLFGDLGKTLDYLERLSPDESIDYEWYVDDPLIVEGFEILPNHRLVGSAIVQKIGVEATAIEVFGWEGDRALASKRLVGSQDIYVVEVKDRAELRHPSHETVRMEQGKYAIVTYPSFFKVD